MIIRNITLMAVVVFGGGTLVAADEPMRIEALEVTATAPAEAAIPATVSESTLPTESAADMKMAADLPPLIAVGSLKSGGSERTELPKIMVTGSRLTKSQRRGD